MRRVSTGLVIVSLTFTLGMTADGCAGGAGGILGLLRAPPVIIPSGASVDTLVRTFSVDLRNHPETQRISWDFGDGGVAADMPVATGRTIRHQFPRNGTYVVTVHLFGPPDMMSGRSPARIGVATLPVQVIGPNQPPVPAIAIADVVDEGDVSPVVRAKRFSAAASRDPDGTIVDYEWDFGDGGTGQGQIVTHTFEQSGQFTIRLLVRDDRGAEGSLVRQLNVNALPIARFSFEATSSDGLTFRFDGSASSDPDGQITRFRWDFGDGSAEGTGVIVTHTYTTPDDYEVVLHVTDNTGGTSRFSERVDVTGVDPFIRSVSPEEAVKGRSDFQLTITGENFVSGMRVELFNGILRLPGTNVQVEGPTLLRAVFDLSNAALGLYIVRVFTPAGEVAELADVFRIVSDNHVRLTTSMGDILLELVDDAPITTENFLRYVDERFYDGSIFHRVVPNFVVQGGGFRPGMVPIPGVHDPIVNEFSRERSNVRGTVAMAKTGGNPNSATSQFFVNLADNSQNLDNQNGGFTVFARVIEGMDVVDAIAAVPLNGERPVEDVLLVRARRE